MPNPLAQSRWSPGCATIVVSYENRSIESVQALVPEQVNELYGISGTSAPSRVNDVAVTVIVCFMVAQRTLRFSDASNLSEGPFPWYAWGARRRSLGFSAIRVPARAPDLP